jgi:hypothetical protein
MDGTQKPWGLAAHDKLEPFHRAQSKRLTGVVYRETDEGEEILLAFDDEYLVFSCNIDYDTIHVKFETKHIVVDDEEFAPHPDWDRFIGKDFFWGWLTLNQQGYIDGVLLSFDGVVPEIGMNVIASRFEVLEIRQRA